MMAYGLGTHFNAWVPPERLAQIATRFEWCRIDAQQSSGETTREMIAAVYAAGMRPLTIFDTNDQLAEIPDGEWVEKQNEVNIGLGRPAPIPPNAYRDDALAGYEIAKAKGCRYVAGAAANMERRDIDWFHALDFVNWPADIVAVTHHYVPRDRFSQAHILNPNPLTWTREYEVRQFQKAIGPTRQWMITEFGYGSGPNSSLTPQEAAHEIGLEWAFWEKWPNCLAPFLYQIGDSPVDDHDFGLYDEHGQIKQAIFDTVPLRPSVATTPPNVGEDMPRAEEGVRREDLIPLASGQYAVKWPHGASPETVLSIQPSTGEWETRPITAIGAWESADLKGSKLRFVAEGHTHYVVVD